MQQVFLFQVTLMLHFLSHLPENPVILTHTSNAKTMLIQDWVSEPQQGIATGILQGGFQKVYVGATLKVGTMEDNPVGIYAGYIYGNF